ncbi:nucleoside 2-deoxyribosyltransferase [Levilactobacillus senmaizukei DSM 21775 = NBRC 103853]|uniref:Nucleoside 2-deoxyribosyltransferase n=1 Tax=Levilactobacillus senmaizukei DSM 21775 = NBRC 103853 TaxID=1423803 RepID=A0A0R2DET3_9LACO|nr:nucleoside 2-deoxyribosyltransferase [Levilactobacillus senmaizukei]KRN02070.1 nucleoside 2-deoxyribosyltransferase [Levilactobacillus senmaizukei DSM 21775 = NBRC 103853]
MAQIYIASPFFSDEQVDRVQRVEAALAANPTVVDFYSPRLNQETANEQFTKPWAKEIYERDMTQIAAASLIVTVLDFEAANVDSGTAYELGVATMSHKPIIAIQEKTERVNLMISESVHWYTQEIKSLASYDFNDLPSNEFNGEVL